MNKKTLDELLEEWSVLPPGTWENENTYLMNDWFAIANDDGICAYFNNDKDAFSFRLIKINSILNG